jgi:hypothetical protein
MKIRRLLTLSAVFLLLVSMLTVAYRFSAFAQAQATLTGSILDRGVDTNDNGLYDYLEIDVGINVTVAGNFQVDVNNLMQTFNGSGIPVDNSSQGFLDTGIQYLNVSFDGPTIFNSGLNITEVGLITLYGSENGSMSYLDSEFSTPLPQVYNYTEFDYAFLTGRIFDQGVDTEHNGLFDYLEVGIEFNESEAGQYEISVGGLMEQTETSTNYLYDYEYEQAYFAPGVYTAYLNFSGPEIAYNYFNATNVTEIQLSNSAGVQSSFYALPLSRQYDYTLFDAPSQNMQVNFKVYPDATVAVDGALNYTHMYPENTYLPQMNAKIGFSTTGNTTTETSNGTVVFSGTSYSSLNTTEAHARMVYANGIENDTFNASTTLPPEEADVYPFNTTDGSVYATYSGGLVDMTINGTTVMAPAYATTFPFNMSDATVRADFDGTTLAGNITFHTIGGFPLADVTVYFSGNRSSLQFTGNVNVTYAGFEQYQINETTVDQAIAYLNANITGEGPYSLYNSTLGNLECTSLNVTKIPWSDPTLGADVTYNATVVGNFTGYIAMMFFQYTPEQDWEQLAYASLQSASSSVKNASLVLNYYYESQIAQVNLHLVLDAHALSENLITLVPPAIPSSLSSSINQTQVTALLEIANATLYAVTDAGVNASYSSADGKMTMNGWLLGNDSQLKNDIVSILPDVISPLNSTYLNELLQSYFNTTYSNVTSSTTTFDLVNGTATFASTEVIQGDFEAELNREKSIMIGTLATMEQTGPMPWELDLLNETEINVNNFQAEFSLGQDYMQGNFSGLILKLQPDTVDPITFKLKTWLNTTSDLTVPIEFQKLTITVTGGSAGNATVILSAPPSVPPPDNVTLDGRTMVWNNASMSSLQDLTFLTAFQQPISYDGGTFYAPILTNSTVTSFVFNPSAKQITFNVTGPSGSTGFCNVTIPRDLLNASALSDWTVVLDGKTLAPGAFSITENAQYVFVYMNYTHSEHVITIKGTQLVPEFQPNVLPIVLIILFAFAAIIAVKQRRKLEPARTKLRQTMASLKLSLKPS